MQVKEKIIFYKVLDYLVDKVPKDSLVVAFGSRVRKTRGRKFDFDIMIQTCKAQRFCGKTLGRNFEKQNTNLKDDEGRILGLDVFLDIQFSKGPIVTNNHKILYKNGTIHR